jgi:hypothetical protein
MKLLFYRQTIEKYSCIKFHENPSSGKRVVSWGPTGRHDETNIRVSQFANARWKWKRPFMIYFRCIYVPVSAVDVLILVRWQLFLILNMTFDIPLFRYTSVSLFIHSSFSNQSFDFFAYSQKWLPASFPSVRPAPTERISVKFENEDI